MQLRLQLRPPPQPRARPRHIDTYEPTNCMLYDYHRVFYRAGRQRYSMYLFDGNREQAICVYRRHLRLRTSKYFTLSRSCRPTISGTGPCCGCRWLGSEMIMQRSIREKVSTRSTDQPKHLVVDSSSSYHIARPFALLACFHDSLKDPDVPGGRLRKLIRVRESPALLVLLFISGLRAGKMIVFPK